MSFDRLIDKIIEYGNPTVAGLDPKLAYIPDSIKKRAFEKEGAGQEGAAEAVFQYNKGLIDALCGIVPAVKPQAAYYEMLGWAGVRALFRTVRYAQEKGMFVICDVKRSDIGSTMEAYAAAYLGTVEIEGKIFEPFGCDAITVNPYLGSDGIEPLLPWCKKKDKGIFVLAKTSNDSAGELQDKIMETLPVYEYIGRMCERWGSGETGRYGYSAVGAVVGATYPRQLSSLRKSLPHTFFLVPGYGAQGAGAADVAGAFDGNGVGAVINSSRGLMLAYKKAGRPPEEYASAAQKEALRMKQELTNCIG